jgi:mono/diheme cytochrome c family protein
MYTRKLTRYGLMFALVLTSKFAWAQTPNLGQPLTPADIAAWDINVLPDGTGLPPGSGTPAEGARVYSMKCAVCHGENGKGGSNARLVGGDPIKDMETEKTIANFWPFPTTLFDYIRRAMPWRQPRTLSNNEVYAVTAYILSLNKLIDENEAMNAQTLPKVRMPNRNGFIPRFPDRF